VKQAVLMQAITEYMLREVARKKSVAFIKETMSLLNSPCLIIKAHF